MTIAACAELVARGDPDRFRAAMAAPVSARRVLFPLYAFNLEVARAPYASEEPVIREMRLQWWDDALEEIAAGCPVRRHEVASPLAEAVSAEGAEALRILVKARRRDTDRTPFADDSELAGYLDATGGTLVTVAANALGAAPGPVCRAFGTAMALAAWLRAVPELEARGWVPLPDPRPQAVAALAREGLARLAAARARRGEVSPPARAAFLAGWRSGAVLRAAARAPERVAAGALEESPIRQRAGLMFRALTRRF